MHRTDRGHARSPDPERALTIDSWCFVHAADLHLDTPFVGVGQVDPGVAARLRDASLDAFDALVDLTLARGALFLVLAGDVYDGPQRGMRAQLRFEQGVRRLADAGIHTFVAHGNHDPVIQGWQLRATWPDEVHVFGSDDVTSVPVEHDGVVVAVVQGISYAEVAETRNLARMFARTPAETLHVGVLHANVGGNGEHAPYAPCTVDDLRFAGIDYWALGHVHQRTVVLDGTGGDPWALYPGNLQGRSHKPSERGEKGASVVTVIAGRAAVPEHVPLDRARFVELVMPVGLETSLGEVERSLAAAASRAVDEASGRIVLLRGLVEGAGRAADDLARTDALDGLLLALRDRLAGTPDAVWTSLRDHTRPVPSAAVAELLDGDVLPDDEVVGDALATVSERRWTTALPPAAELADAARSLARTLLAGGDG